MIIFARYLFSSRKRPCPIMVHSIAFDYVLGLFRWAFWAAVLGWVLAIYLGIRLWCGV